ncbi:transcription factor bHLH146-like [Abrus precatorius]|uniref:Transcription factor bHLH146-like n=1 Tax=Abrus precatorius TaxID=3816 RepID=A0A8B8MJ52_ABRPR|nr:transcription factor bHLH146-like [Abrus precatorius]
MEAQRAKRRRVYSLEPSKIVQSIFTRNYLNYLVPALMKIKEKSSIEDNGHCDINNAVKYEVDMAMVLSAQGFAWSNGLNVKLQRDHVNAVKNTSFVESNEAGTGGYDQNENVPLGFSSNPSTKSQVEILGSKCESKDMPEVKRDLAEEKDDDDKDEDINTKLKRLRRLIPGGAEKMCDEQMVAELESYVSCLQMQVNVLQCLLAETR